MSWQSYVDVNLLGSPNVEKASIFGHDGSLWATSAGFQISASEVKKVIDAFVNPSDAQANGLYLEGKKYVLLRADGTVIYARSGATGVCLTKTNQAVLVGYYAENMSSGSCNTVVETLADYLRDQNY